MPIYRYKHDCGYSHDFFLKTDQQSIVVKCERCKRGVTARQVRDKSVTVAENNETRGVLRHDNGR